MKRVIALLLCLVMMVGVLAACTPDDEGHTHTYSETWKSDAEGHWYEATCDCEDVLETKLAHSDKNNDGACDICEFTNHTHTYAEEWTADCTNHWNAADCGHVVVGANVAAHADEDGDGKCDVCAYMIEDIHTHYYASEWTTDGEYHWHAALCEHGVEVSGKEAHVIDAAGYCTVCLEKVREIDVTDIQAVLNAAIARNDKVVDGNVTASQLVYDGSGANLVLSAGQTNEIFYALGKDSSYIFYKSFDMYGEYSGGDHQWYERISEDEVFGVQMVANSYVLEVIAGDAQFLNGYTYHPGSILPSDSDDTSTLANTIAGIYALGKAGVNVDNFEEDYDAETGVYSIQFSYFTVNATEMSDDTIVYQVYLYGVAIEFSVDDNGVIDLANFAVSSYRNWEVDHDIDYDPETNTITMLDSANPTIYAYSVSQRSGERTFTTPYPKSSLIPVDFELSLVTGTDYNDGGQMYITSEELLVDTDEDGLVELNTVKDQYVRLHLSSLVPQTAIASALNIDDFSMSYVNNDPSKAGELWRDADFLRPSFSGYMDCINFKVADPGEYTVTITFGDLTKVIEIIVPGEEPVVVPENTATQYFVVTTDTYGWFDEYTFTATESGTYTFTIPVGLGIQLDGSNQPEIDYYSANGGTVSFDLAAGATQGFTVGAITKDVWEIGVSFVAGDVEVGGGDGGDEGDEPGAIADDISGTYYAGTNTLVINNDGTMVFTYNGTALNYTYAIDGDVVTYTLGENGAPYTSDNYMAVYYGYLTFGADGMPATFEYNGTSYALSITTGGGDEGGDEGDDEGDEQESIVSGANTVVFTEDEVSANTATRPLTITEAGNYKFAAGSLFIEKVTDANGADISKNSDYTYTLEAGEYTVTFGMLTNFGIGADVPYALNVELQAAEEEEEIVSSGAIYADEENPITVTDDHMSAGKLYVSFMPWDDGEYYLYSNDLYVQAVLNADGTEVARNDDGNFELVGFTTYYVEISTTWAYSAGEYTVVVERKYPEGHQSNPIWYTLGETVNAAYAADYNTVWYQFYANATGTLTLSSDFEGVFLLLTAKPGDDITNENGESSITLDVVKGRQYYIAVAAFEATEPVEIPFTASIEEGDITTDGTVNVPHQVVLGDNTANAPAWNYVWFMFKAEANGTITFTSTSDNYTWYATASINEIGVPVSEQISMKLGMDEVVYLCISTEDGAAGEIPFAATWAADPVEVWYENNVIVDGSAANEIVIAENNTYVSLNFYGNGSYVLTWDNADAIVELLAWGAPNTPVANGGTVTAGMFGTNLIVYLPGYATGTVNLTITPYSASAQELVVGDNTVSVTDTQFGQNVSFTATEAGTYLITVGANGVVDKGGEFFFENDVITVDLAAGESVSIIVLTYDYSASDVIINVTLQGAEGGDDGDEGDETGLAGSGTQNDPWVLETLPYTANHANGHDVYYTFTATADGILTVVCPTGCLVTNNMSVTKDGNGNYVFSVTAGTTVSLNTWDNTSNADTCTYEFTFEEKAGGDEGGETGAISWVGANGSGRAMRVIIDKSAGTMSIIRAALAGNSLDLATGATESKFSYSFDGTNVTYSFISGTNCTVTFDAAGDPVEVIWSSATYTGFTVEA